MPQVTEDQAIQAIDLSKQIDNPEQKQRLGALVAGYKAQQEKAGAELFPKTAARERQEQARVRVMFQDRDTHGFTPEQFADVSQTFVNNDEGKAGYLADHFLSQTFQRPTKEIRVNRDQFRDQYALAKWGKPVATNKEFQDRLAAEYDFEDERDNLAITSAVSGKSLEESVSEFDFESVESDQYKGREDERKRQFTQSYRSMKAAIAPLEYQANAFAEELKTSMGVEGSSKGDVKPDEWFLNQLMEIPKDERGLFLDLIRARGGDGEPTEDKSLFQAMSERMGRQSGNMYQGIKLAGNLSAIDTLERHIVANGAPEEGLPEEFGFNAGEILSGETGLNVMAAGRTNSAKVPAKGSDEWEALPEESKVALDRMQEEKDFALLYKQVNDIATGVVDPSQASGVYGKALLGVSGMAPNLVLMSAGPVGAMVNMAAYQGVHMNDIMERNPGMNIGEAQAASSVIGVGQGLADLIPFKVIQGKTPFLNTWLNQASLTTKSLSTRFVARVAGGSALELGQEFGQDVLIPQAVESLVKQFDESFNDVQFEERIGGFTSSESLSELIPSIVALSLIGAGAGSIRDFRGGQQLAGNYNLLIAAGINESRASEIRSLVKSNDLDAAETKLREAFVDTDNKSKPAPEIVFEARQKLVAERVETLATIDQAQELNLMPEFAFVGGKYELRFRDGSEARTFESSQEAQEEQWRIVQDANIKLHTADRSIIEHLNSSLRDKRGNLYKFSNLDPTTGDAAAVGITTPAAARNRQEIRKQSEGREETVAEPVEEVTIEQEFETAKVAANLATDPSENSDLTDIILGSNSTDFANGVETTTITLFRSATPFTTIEEKTEGDVEVMYKDGHGPRVIAMLRQLERDLDTPLFLKGKQDKDLTLGDIKEAWSDVTLSYFAVRNEDNETGGIFNSKSFQRDVQKVLNGDMGGPLTAYAHLIKSIYSRAEKLDKLRRKGKLDADLETELARSVGFSEQHEFNRDTENEAAKIKEELESDFDLSSPALSSGADLDMSDDAPFSVIGANAADFDTQKNKFFGIDGKERAELDTSQVTFFYEFRLSPPKLAGLKRLGEEKTPARWLFEQANEGMLKLRNLLDFDALYRSYPNMRDVYVKTAEMSPGTRGQLKTIGTAQGTYYYITVGDNTSIKEFKSTLLHEIQHVIQREAGFDSGSNLSKAESEIVAAQGRENFLKDEVNQEWDRLESQAKGEIQIDSEVVAEAIADLEGENLEKAKSDPSDLLFWVTAWLADGDAGYNKARKERYKAQVVARRTIFEHYKATPGEVEARGVQARQSMTAAERAANPFMDDFTSFSTIAQSQDTDYLAAVESGDMEAAQAMVDDAAKAAGYGVKGFHVTNEKFDKFDPDKAAMGGVFWFTETRSKIDGDATGAGLRPGKEKIILDVYLKADNQAGWNDYNNLGLGEIEERGFDSVKLDDDYIIFNSNQVKSADPITYDSNGEVIPLSQRFDSGRDEISFSTIAETKKERVARYDAIQGKVKPRSPAIKMKTGHLFTFSELHVQFITKNRLHPEDIESGGWTSTEGIYNASHQSDTARWAERAKARLHVSRVTGEPDDIYSFSTISNPEQRISAMFSPFQRSPELRVKLGQEMQRRSARESQKWAPIIAARKSKKEINEARKEKEAELIQEKLETLTPATIGALESGATLDDTAQRPILTNLLSRKTYTRKDGKVVGYWAGSLLSKSKAKKQGKNVNEYDDIANMNLPPYIWGGNTTPDQAASAQGFESISEFWTELEKEIESFREVSAATKEAEQTIRDLEKEAKTEAKQWADELQEQSDVVGTDRANLLAGLRTLEAIKSALPYEVSGRIGGVTKLASLTTPVAMLKEIERVTQRIDKELEKYLKKEADKLVKKLLEKTTKPAKDEAGKLRKGKAGADIHSLFDTVRDVWKQGWSMERAEGYAVGLEMEIEKGELTAEQEAHKLLEAEMVRMFGGWADKDSAARTNAYQEAQEIWTHAYHAWKEAKAKEKEHRDEVRADLIASTGKRGTGGEKDLAEISGVTPKGKAKEFAFSLLNFDQLVSWTFGKESKWAKWFADTEREAENTKRDAITATVDSVEDLFTDLAGGKKFKGEQLQFKMSRKSIEATDALGDVRKLSELEAVTALLMWQQEDGKRHMGGRRDEGGLISSTWSYDADFIDELSSKLSNEAWQVLVFLNAQYGGEYEGLNAVYKELYGVNLPQNPNYSPLTMNPLQGKSGETVDPVTGTSSSSGSFTPGSLRSRGVAIAEPQFRDAIVTFIGHKKQIEHWKAYAVFTRDANAILGNRDVSNSAIAAHGQESVSIIRKWLDAFAQGGTRDAAAGIAMNRGLQKWIGNAQSMALVGRLGTVAVQATQLGAAAAKMPTGAYLKRLGKLLSGNLEWKAAFNSDYIRRRLSEQPVIIQQAMEGLKAGKPTQLRHQVAKIGKLIGGADALFTAGTFAMVYDYQYSQAIKSGASTTEAATLAGQEAERITDEIAQPTRMGARSFMEVSATNPMLKLAWAFGSESRKNLALMVYSGAKGTAAEKAQAALYVVLLNGLIASVIRAAWRDMRDDDDEVFDERNWSFKRLALATSTDWLFGFPVVGEGIQKAIFSMAGEFTFDGNLMDPVKDLGTAPIKLLTGESSNELRDLEKILTALGLFNNNAASATSLMHILRDAVGATKNLTSG